MKKIKEFEVNTIKEFQGLVDKKDFTISQAIVNSILSNLKTRKKHIHILSVKCLDENTILDITLEKSHFAEALKENLKYFIENEMYEECQKISEAIENLNEK
jgi:hypothetical protein